MSFLIADIYHMKKAMRLPRKQLDRIRFQLFKKQIQNIYENVPFYRETFIRRNITPSDFKSIHDICKLPVISKEMILSNYSSFLNDSIKLTSCFKSHTSGATGQPFATYFDKNAWLRKKYLSKLRARFSCGMKPGEKVAIFESEPVENLKKQNRKHPLRDLLLKIRYFSIFDNIDLLIKNLIAFNPQNAYGPPSFFFQLAKSINDMHQEIPSLRRVFTSSEYMQTDAKQFISNVLQAEVFDVYGSTEFKEVAWECDYHRGYHINEDEIICEILHDDKPVMAGEIGDIVLTDLRNSVMPIIRYRIHDRGRLLPDSCRCGCTFSLMMPVAGRASDYILLPDGEKISPFQFTTSIEKFKGLLQYQLVQKSATDIIINIIADGKRDNDLLINIENAIKKITRGQMKVNVKKTDRIGIEENGKFKVVQNLLQHKCPL